MGALDLKPTMQALADALLTVDGITKAYRRPTEAVETGGAVVGYPTDIAFHQTFQRGMEKVTIPVWIVLGLWDDDLTLDAMSDLVGTGTASAVTALEQDGAVSVRRGGIERFMTKGGIVHAALRLDCDILT